MKIPIRQLTTIGRLVLISTFSAVKFGNIAVDKQGPAPHHPARLQEGRSAED
jgi:hypothetical protein